MVAMQATFTYTPEEYADAQRAWRKNLAPARTRYGIRIIPAVGVILLLCGAYLLISGIDVFWSSYDLLIGAILVFCYCAPFQAWRFRREFRRTKSLQGEKTFEIDHDGVRQSSSYGNGILKWNAFSGYAETPSVWVLSMPPRTFYMIPKHAFASAEQEAVSQLLQQEIVRHNP